MKIVLLRHGRPETDLSGYLSAKELKELVKDYKESGITDVPSDNLIKSFKGYTVVCSDLLRSKESAKKLGFKNIELSSATFNEADLPFFNKSIINLPVTAWVIFLRIIWLFGFNQNGESFFQAKKRSEQAAKKLIKLSQTNEKIIVVGHGLMNRLIAKQLLRENWMLTKKKGRGYWEYSAFSKGC